MNARLATMLAAVLALASAAAGYTVHVTRNVTRDGIMGMRSAARGEVPTGERISAVVPGQIFFRNMAAGPDFGKIARSPIGQPGAIRRMTEWVCDRFAVADGSALCLAAQPAALPPMTYVIVLDANLRERRRLELPGSPSRAKLSPDGKLAFWTLFVSGDSYSMNGFSTRAGILDVTSGALAKTIEGLPIIASGKRYFSSDVNFWGITFAADNRRFYATMASKGRTYLVQADYASYRGQVLEENVECPSLSPDGQRIAFKKRALSGGAVVWRLSVLDLRTREQTALAEVRSVDDQAVWLDDRTLLYALPAPDGGSDVWSVPADGSGSARLEIASAASPAVVLRPGASGATP